MGVLREYDAASGLWRAVGGMGLPQSPVSFSAHKNGVNQTGIAANTIVKLTFPNTYCNFGNDYDVTTSRFTPSVAGMYIVSAGYRLLTSAAGIRSIIYLYKNGIEHNSFGWATPIASSPPSVVPGLLLYMNGTTDYLEVYCMHENANTRDVNGNPIITYFQACLIPDSYDSTKQIVDLSAATSDYLLGVGETAKIMYSGVTSLSLHIKTEEGVYELSIDQPYVTTNTVEGAVSLSPNEATYTNSFVFSESRTDNLVNAAGGVATFTGWRDGATCSKFPLGNPYVMTGSYRISTRTNSKSVTGQCVRLGGVAAPLTMQSEVFAGIWKDTTTVWSSLGTITFPFAQSGTIIIKRVV